MIFGNNIPKIVFNSTDYLLEKSTLDYDFNEVKNIENTTYDNGKVDHTILGAYVNANIIVHLFKFADPVAKFNELMALNGKYVDFYPHNISPVKDLNDNIVKFFTKCSLISLDEHNKYSALKMVLRSESYCDTTKLVEVV